MDRLKAFFSKEKEKQTIALQELICIGNQECDSDILMSALLQWQARYRFSYHMLCDIRTDLHMFHNLQDKLDGRIYQQMDRLLLMIQKSRERKFNEQRPQQSLRILLETIQEFDIDRVEFYIKNWCLSLDSEALKLMNATFRHIGEYDEELLYRYLNDEQIDVLMTAIGMAYNNVLKQEWEMPSDCDPEHIKISLLYFLWNRKGCDPTSLPMALEQWCSTLGHKELLELEDITKDEVGFDVFHSDKKRLSDDDWSTFNRTLQMLIKKKKEDGKNVD